MPLLMRRWGWFVLILAFLLSLSFTLAQTDSGLYTLPGSNARLVTSGSMTLAREGRLLIIANMLNNTASIVEPGQSNVRAEIPVGKDPRTVAVTPDQNRALVVNRGDGTLSVIALDTQTVTATFPVGSLPYGVVTVSDSLALVAVQGTDEIIQLDLNTGVINARIPVPDDPAGLALWGDLLYVSHLWSGSLTLIHVPQLRAIETISAGSDVGLSQSVTIDPQRGLAYLPQTRLNAQNPALTFDTTQFPVVNVFDLQDLRRLPLSQLTLDTADRPVNMPFSTVLDSQRRWLYVANAGSNNISVIDLTSGLATAHIPTRSNPRTVLLSRDTGTLYIHSMIEGSVMLVDTRSFRVLDEIPVSVLTIPSDVYLGAQLFHSAADKRMSQDAWLSCATCHFDGQSDGRVWQGFEGGPRNTPLLYNLGEKQVYNWSGTWDELADVELKIRWLHHGRGLIPGAITPTDSLTDISPDLDTLTAYLLTLEGTTPPPAPDPALVERGAEVFEALNCASCHSGETSSDGLRHDVQTGGEFITPRLRWLWLSAPYFHDGSAPTLLDVFIMPGDHELLKTTSFADIEALVAYLNTLPNE